MIDLMARKEVIREAVENLNTDDLIILWNDFCEEFGWDEDVVYYWETNFDDQYQGATPEEVARAIFDAEKHYQVRPQLFQGGRYYDLVLLDEDSLIDVIGIDDLVDDIANAPENYEQYDFLEDAFEEINQEE